MTTPIDSTSPFINTPTNEKSIQEVPVDISDFSIHTMQDDLLNLQKKRMPFENINKSAVPEKIAPSQSQESTPAIKEASPKISAPFVEKVNIPSKKEDFGEVYVPAPTKTRFVILLIITALITIAIILGGYYFLFGRSPKQATVTTDTQPVKIQQPEETPLETIPVASMEKYSAEKPNYLILDITTLSPENIKEKIISIIEELKAQSNNQVPYEFIVVDANNNPVAFPIFATAAKLNLSPLILSDLGETFSLFIYNDNGNSRLSFAADIIKKDILPSELLKQEKTFITDASFLFLNEKPEIIKGSFQDNVYKNVPLRFFNVNKGITMSIDYAIVNNKLLVATSKTTVRVILDKLLIKIVSGPAQESNKNSAPIDSSSGNPTAVSPAE